MSLDSSADTAHPPRKVFTYTSQGEYAGLPNYADIDSSLSSILFIHGSILSAAKAKENQDEWEKRYEHIGTPWKIRRFAWRDNETEEEESYDVTEILSRALTNETFLNRYDTTVEMLTAVEGMLSRWHATSVVPEIKIALENSVKVIREKKRQLEEEPDPQLDAKRYLMSQLRLIFKGLNELFSVDMKSYMGEKIPEILKTSLRDRDDWDKRIGRLSPYLEQFDDILQEVPEGITATKSTLDTILMNIELAYVPESFRERPSAKNKWRRMFNLNKEGKVNSAEVEKVKTEIRNLFSR